MSNLEIMNFKPIRKGYVVARLDVLIQSVGLVIRDVTVFNKEGAVWFNFPSRKFEDSEGNTAYYPYLHIPDTRYAAAFQRGMRRVFDQYLIENPEVLNESYDKCGRATEDGGPAF